MKKLKLLLASTLLTVSAIAPLGLASASAEQNIDQRTPELICRVYDDGERYTTCEGCDLGVSKQVSVNDGEFSEADSAAAAAQAKVGDKVVWKIVVSNTSTIEGKSYPVGTVTVKDIVPAGLNVTGLSYTAGSFMDGNWTFDLSKNLPATLTVTTTATTAGLIVNTAALSEYTPPHYDYKQTSELNVSDAVVIPKSYPYKDADPSNDSNSAYINVVAPVVTTAAATPAAPNTGLGDGSGWAEAAVLTLGAVGALGSAYGIRKNFIKQV